MPEQYTIEDEYISQELSIHWDESIENLDYVRESIAYAGTRQRGVPWHGAGRRVGYAILRSDADNDGHRGYFERRVVWLKDYDRDSDPHGVYETGTPSEGVAPLTVAPGIRGKKTPRASGKCH